MSWTLKQPRTRSLRQGEKQKHEAALRASRYTRRHAWQFHGAGAEEAVQKLRGLREFGDVSNAMRGAMVRMGTMLALPTAVLTSYEDTQGPFVVGWWYEDQHYLCNAHRRPGAVPVKAVDVTSSTACRDCGARLLGLAPAGWKSPSGLLLCPEHSHANGTPLTATELPEGATCAVCSEGLTP